MKYVLFVCTHNAGRSQMAQAFFEREGPAGVGSPEEIRACADAILDRYDDVPVRSHIPSLANRAARDCLVRERCDALTAT